MFHHWGFLGYSCPPRRTVLVICELPGVSHSLSIKLVKVCIQAQALVASPTLPGDPSRDRLVAVASAIRWRRFAKLVLVMCALIRFVASLERLEAPVVFRKVKLVGSIVSGRLLVGGSQPPR